MTVALAPIALVFALFSGATELLDVVDSAAYWRLKGVTVTADAMLAELAPDPPAAAPGALGAGPKAKAVRRLMAIRTLGEMKASQALPALRTQLRAKAPFVAEYAARALAAIEGKPAPARASIEPPKTHDVWLMPAECGAVGHVNLRRAAPMAPGEGLDLGSALGPMLGRMVTKAAVFAAEQVGNVRLDSLTVGVSGAIDNDTGFVVVLARALYDREAMKAAALQAWPRARVRTFGGVEAVSHDAGEVITLLLPSNRCLAAAIGPRGQTLPLEALARGLATGKGGLRDNEVLAGIVDSVDRTKAFFAAARMTASYKKLEPLAVFDAVTLSCDVKPGAMTFEVKARGADADKVQAAVAEFQATVDRAKAELRAMPALADLMKPYLAFMDSLETKVDGGAVRATATLQGDLKSLLMPALAGMRSAVPAVPADARAASGLRIRLARVRVEVTVNGRPLNKGSVMFSPDRSAGNRGRPSHGVIANGRADLTCFESGDGAIVGWHKVSIHALEPVPGGGVKERIPPRYNMKTTLKARVDAGKANVLQFDLKIPGFKQK